MLDTLQAEFRKAAPAVDFCALRFVEETSEYLNVRKGVAEPPQLSVRPPSEAEAEADAG